MHQRRPGRTAKAPRLYGRDTQKPTQLLLQVYPLLILILKTRTLLFAPFSPFIVISIIETQDAALLRHLQSFVESIHSAPHVSDTAPEEDAARAEMDSHLAALGLALGLAAPGFGSGGVPSQLGEPQQGLHRSVDTEAGHNPLGHGYRQLERHPGEGEEPEPVMRMGHGDGEAELDPDPDSALDLDLGGCVSANRAITGLI
ncbi:hypothetical protein BDV19DRAFT_385862 [Aspergillus venezuelensis]